MTPPTHTTSAPADASVQRHLRSAIDVAVRNASEDGGFDDAAFYDFFTATRAQRDELLPVHHVGIDNRTAPFETWAANTSRTAY